MSKVLSAAVVPPPPPLAFSRDSPPHRSDSTYSAAPSTLNPTSSQTSRLEPLSVVEPGEGIDSENEHEGTSLPPVDRGFHAWAYVVAAFLLETVIWGYSYSFATVLVYLESHDPWQSSSIASLSAIGTTQLGLQFIAPLGVVLIYQRYPEYVKTILWVCVGINCGSMLLSSWAKEVWQLIVLQGILCGISGAFLWTPVLLWLSEWWIERRGLSCGIIFSGTGIGGFVFPFLIDALLGVSEKDGFAWLCRGWALFTFVLFCVAVYLIKPRVPPPKPSFRRGGPKRERGKWLAGYGSFASLKNPIFITMALATFLSSLSTLPVSLNIGVYSASVTESSLNRQLSISLFNAASACGCTLTGWMADRSYAHATTLCGLGCAIIALTAFAIANTLTEVLVFAIVFGLCASQVAAWSSSAKDVAGKDVRTSSLIFFLLSLIRGVASILMPFVSELLYNKELAGVGTRWGSFGFKPMIIFGLSLLLFVSLPSLSLPLSSFNGILLPPTTY